MGTLSLGEPCVMCNILTSSDGFMDASYFGADMILWNGQRKELNPADNHQIRLASFSEVVVFYHARVFINFA